MGSPNPPVPEADAKEKLVGKGKDDKLMVIHGGGVLPDFVEKWNRNVFYYVGTLGLGLDAILFYATPYSWSPWILGTLLFGYWYRGIKDIRQTKQAIPQNFPVLGHVRYIFESLRPEIRQYFIESDTEASPFTRENRSIVYQRAKGDVDTMPLGTRRDVYGDNYEWANHSIWPKVVQDKHKRVIIGGPHCKQPYSASLFNISAMSYGALSNNAILALNSAAKAGNFYHNTGEGGISRFHKEPGGDIVWNIGTGYFGCRNKDGTFSPEKFAQTASSDQVKMIELKLSQGAKPGHGGLLPGAKVTAHIAEARGVAIGEDCNSPSSHSAFHGPEDLIRFIDKLRFLSAGKPVGFKLCVGHPLEIAAIVQAMLKLDITPDFITIDGGEGGTGAAPPEYSNHLGTPLIEGLTLVHNLLIGSGLRDRVKIISAGKVLTGFGLVKQLALGADLCNCARGMMFALGCIQALKCNTNKCPTGVATQDPELQKGLHVPTKAIRVASFQRKTLESAFDIIGSIGLDNPVHLTRNHIYKRVEANRVYPYSKIYPEIEPNSLLEGTAPPWIQNIWEKGRELLDIQSAKTLSNAEL